MDLGPWVNDPRITRQNGYGVATARGHVIYVGDRFATQMKGATTWHDDLPSALRALLGEPRTALVHALAVEFTAEQLVGMASAIAEEGWSDTGTAFEVLRSALVEAGRVS